jgi:hypothetical protein
MRRTSMNNFTMYFLPEGYRLERDGILIWKGNLSMRNFVKKLLNRWSEICINTDAI